MKLIADSGSTKTDWIYKDNEGVVILRYSTKGINPIHLTNEEISERISSLIDACPDVLNTDSIEFYGSGCNALGSQRIHSVLSNTFGENTNILVDSDIIGAAKALFADKEGIACILGTGANSCHWHPGTLNLKPGTLEPGTLKPGTILSQTPALGYILGDEGSGAVLGKNLINAIYKKTLPDYIREEFETTYQTNMMDVIDKVYRQPAPNTWLASLSPFVYKHLDIPEMESLVIDNFSLFFQRNILPYNRPDLPVSFVGSMAAIYRPQLEHAAQKFKITIGDILKSPIDKL